MQASHVFVRFHQETLQLQSAVQRAELQTVLQEFETFKSAFRHLSHPESYLEPPKPIQNTAAFQGIYY